MSLLRGVGCGSWKGLLCKKRRLGVPAFEGVRGTFDDIESIDRGLDGRMGLDRRAGLDMVDSPPGELGSSMSLLACGELGSSSIIVLVAVVAQ